MVVLVVECRHAFRAQYRAVGEGVEVLTQIELGVLLALVTQAVLARRAGQLEAGLRIAVDRFADPAAHVAGELQCMGAQRQRQTRNGAGNAQGCQCFFISTPLLLLLIAGSSLFGSVGSCLRYPQPAGKAGRYLTAPAPLRWKLAG